MAQVWIPRRLQSLTGGRKMVEVTGSTVRRLIDSLENQYPGLKARLYDAERDSLAPGIAVTIDGVVREMGLLEKVQEESEVHFLPAISGG